MEQHFHHTVVIRVIHVAKHLIKNFKAFFLVDLLSNGVIGYRTCESLCGGVSFALRTLHQKVTSISESVGRNATGVGSIFSSGRLLLILVEIVSYVDFFVIFRSRLV